MGQVGEVGQVIPSDNKWRRKAKEEHKLMEECNDNLDTNGVSAIYNIVATMILVFCNLLKYFLFFLPQKERYE